MRIPKTHFYSRKQHLQFIFDRTFLSTWAEKLVFANSQHSRSLVMENMKYSAFYLRGVSHRGQRGTSSYTLQEPSQLNT